MTSPPLLAYGVVRLDGSELAPEIAALVVGLRVRDSLRLPDQAFVRLADPLLKQVDQGLLSVGRALEVLYASPGAAAPGSVFKGKIQSIELELVGDGAFIAATAYEPAFALHQNRRTRVFQTMTAGDIAESVITSAGLTPAVESSASSSEPYPFMLQNDETDWQLLWRLAGAIDYEVVGEDGTVHFRPAGSATTGSPLHLHAPEQLISFRPRVSGAQQVDTVVVRGWDPASAEAIVASKSPPGADSTPGLDRSDVASAAGGGTWTVGDRTVLSHDEADALAGSLAARMSNAWIEAEGVAVGDPQLRAGCRVQVSGVGERFGGTYMVTGATHLLIGGQGYQTHFTISGRSARTLVDLVDVASSTPIWGTSVVVGVVSQINDPDGLGRVRVQYPALGDDAEGWWARIASPAAGTSRGLLMMPVVGDEVVLAFEQGDPRRPYVLGSVWNGQATPGDLVKPDGSFSLASDHDVSVTAAGQAMITATEALTLKGQNISAQAESEVEVKGATITVQADGSVTVKGASITLQSEGNLSVQASGAVQISGAAVMLG
ncbi:MAG TPA: VgrG-related protein [Solirubrobacteraceae bacterium]|jgi:phage protein D|nr:VgrG-related protein [Solirubrobacteraceae bacterium]